MRLLEAVLFAMSMVSLADAIPADEVTSATGISAPEGPNALADGHNEEIIQYPSDFFDRYQPQTALDMVRQLPGFQIDDGGDKRGFGGAAGNILINGRWPSTKEDLPSAILSRIPVGHVARVDLVRGRLRGIDLRGKSVVANVILRDDIRAAIQWVLANRHNLRSGSTPSGSIALADHWTDITYSVGIDSRFPNNGDYGPENVFDGSGRLIETRFSDSDRSGFEGWDLNGFMNASTWFGETFVQVNTNAGAMIRDEMTITSQIPQVPDEDPSEVHTEVEIRDVHFEIGMDAERLLHQDLLGKAIVLFNYLHQYPDTTQHVFDTGRNLIDFRLARNDAVGSEAIARLEFNWAGRDNHAVQFNLEGALNVLDNGLVQTVRAMGGELVELDLPGANTRVEEIRGDFLVRDVWTLRNFILEYGLGAEISSLSTTGDSNQERIFTFLKPEAMLTYAAVPQQQTRFRVAKELAQLDLNDFVSATVFLDDDLTLGNPDLEPESRWVAEVSHERRFGKLGVVTLTAFHHWISDVQDLLPITQEFEAPGNIGNGRRWGAEIESTVPLEWLGLRGSRLDVRVRLQDSVVTDPVTGEERVFTPVGGKVPAVNFENDTDYAYRVAYRQDFEAENVSWGLDVADQGKRPQFKVNELDVLAVGPDFNAFIETTRWWGVKLRLDVMNILNYELTRDRTVFVGERGISEVEFREMRAWKRSPRVQLSVSGTFQGW